MSTINKIDKNRKNKIDIYSTFKLSCNQFKNRRITSLTNNEKLLMVEEVLSYPLMNGRMSKLCKYIGFKNIKYLKKLMAIYPMLLLLNHKQISLHLINKWNEWKCNIKRGIIIENVTNNDLKLITIENISLKIKQNDKGIGSLLPKEKLWLCTYILSRGGKSFISSFKTELNINITNNSLYNIYYNFCGYMMLCGQFPLSTQGMNIIRQWWNEVKRVFGFGYNNTHSHTHNIYKRNNIKMTKKYKNMLKSKKRNIKLNEKVIAIRDIIYGKKQIEEYMQQFDVKQRTIIRWINNSKQILQKCEAESGLDDIWGIYNDDNNNNNNHIQPVTIVSVPSEQSEQNDIIMNESKENENKNENKNQTQFKIFLDKAREYLNINR
eukprot:247877_1